MKRVLKVADTKWLFLVHSLDKLCFMPCRDNEAWKSLTKNGAHVQFMDAFSPEHSRTLYGSSMHNLMGPALLTKKIREWLLGGEWVALDPDTDVQGKAMKYVLFAASFIFPKVTVNEIHPHWIRSP
jgi:hypothetical protein